MSYEKTKTHKNLLMALQHAVRRDLIPRHLQSGDPIKGSFSLMHLEAFYDGPGCGAAGGIVKRWPPGGVLFSLTLGWRTVRLIAKRVRVGNRTDIEVEEA